jgi:hypothetical protein
LPAHPAEGHIVEAAPDTSRPTVTTPGR